MRIQEHWPEAVCTGLELDEHTAAIARRFADELSVQIWRPMSAANGRGIRPYPAGDIIEHLREPEKIPEGRSPAEAGRGSAAFDAEYRTYLYH